MNSNGERKMPTQEQYEESDVGKAERLRIQEHFKAMFPNMGTDIKRDWREDWKQNSDR